MDWSATLSLTTSRAPQHRANYGSFGSSGSLSRTASSTAISIPESIPEHQCVLQFSSPRLKHAELYVIEQYEAATSDEYAKRTAAGSTTITITETETSTKTSHMNTFKMLLTSSSASTRIHAPLTSGPATALAVDAANETADDAAHASSYWLQERQRMMLKRKQRYLSQNGSPTKAASLRGHENESSGWRTAGIMCSVPLVLVLVFVVVVLAFGDGMELNPAAVTTPHTLNTAVVTEKNNSTTNIRIRSPTSLRSVVDQPVAGGALESPLLASRSG